MRKEDYKRVFIGLHYRADISYPRSGGILEEILKSLMQ
jgi:hypothetical protein